MAQASLFAAHTDTLSHVHGLLEAFRAFDSDNDGSITGAELRALMSSLGYNATEQEVTGMIGRDGLLSLEEFLAMNAKDLDLGELGEVLADASEALSGGTAVSGEELLGVMARLGLSVGLEECEEMVGSMDVDGDGVVSMEDFNLIVNCLL